MVNRAEALAEVVRLLGAGHLEAARTAGARWLAAAPADADALHLLGVVQTRRGDTDQGIRLIRRALRVRPDDPAFLCNLGAALRTAGRPAEAVTVLRAAVRHAPGLADAHYNLGNALAEAGEPAAAAGCFRAALDRRPGFVDARLNLGNALAEMERPREAEAAYREALRQCPNHAATLTNLGNLLLAQGDPAAAEATSRQAVASRPDDPVLQWNLGRVLLAIGKLPEGWTLYEAGRACGQRLPPRRFRAPAWDGGPAGRRRLLVWREQGLGDEIRFAGGYGDMIARCGHCIIEAAPRLRSILARSFPGAEVRDEPAAWGPRDDEDFDGQVAAGSLPRHLRPTVESFPRHRGYLVADPERVRFWRHRIGALGGGRAVGVSWTSGLVTPGRRREFFYTELSDWRPVFAVPECVFVSLQYGDHEAEIRAAEAELGVRLHRWPDLDLRDDLESVLALVSVLDAVVSARNLVVDMAGGLGVPVFTSLPRGSDQVLGTEDIPWYPSARVFFRRDDEPHAARLTRMAAVLAGVARRIGD